MVLGELREHADVEGDVGEPIEREPVRGRLDDGVLAAGLEHLGEQALDVGRFGRAHAAVVHRLARPDPRLDGVDQPGLLAGGLEGGVNEQRGRRLAVRAGDTDDGQALRGVALVRRGDRGERTARIRHGDHGDAEAGHGGLAALLDDERGGASGNGGRRELVPVEALAGDTDEEIAGLHLAGVEVHGVDGRQIRPIARLGGQSGPPVAACAHRGPPRSGQLRLR